MFQLFGKIIKGIVKLVLLAIIVAIVIPVGYFAVRAGQPMEHPEYKGLTYYQYLDWQDQEHKRLWEEVGIAYKEQHPESYDDPRICVVTSLDFEIPYHFVQTALYTYAGMNPDWYEKVPPGSRKSVPEGVTWGNFLPKWWLTFEDFQLGSLEHRKHAPSPYCRIPDHIPDDYARSVGALPPEEAAQK